MTENYISVEGQMLYHSSGHATSTGCHLHFSMWSNSTVSLFVGRRTGVVIPLLDLNDFPVENNRFQQYTLVYSSSSEFGSKAATPSA